MSGGGEQPDGVNNARVRIRWALNGRVSFPLSFFSIVNLLFCQEIEFNRSLIYLVFKGDFDTFFIPY